MPSVEIPFGEFLPDAADFRNPGCVVANNCVPNAGGYGPFLGAGTSAGTATGACLGAQLLERSDGTVITVAGGSTRLWVDIDGTVTETTGLSDIGDNYWQFLRFNQYVFAVAPANDLQYLTDIDSDTSWGAVTDAPTQAKVIGEVGSRVVVGNLTGNPYGFQWSALNDPTTWTADATNYCGSAEADHRYGAVTGIAGDRFSCLFQERAVNRIERVGPPSVFQVTRIEEARGCIAPSSIVPVGHLTFFLAHDGFCATNGAEVQRIGSSKVNKWFLDRASQADLFRTHGAVDWQNECVIWSYYSSEGAYTSLMIYSWAQNRWSTAEFSLQRMVEGYSAGVTLDGLAALFASLDDVTPDLDSPQWRSGDRVLSVYRANGANTTLYNFDGTALEATFETGEFQPSPGQRGYVSGIYPLVENTSANTTAALIYRNTKGGAETTSTAGTVNDAGFCPVRGDGRYMRARMTVPAGAVWDKAQGVQPAVKGAGMR